MIFAWAAGLLDVVLSIGHAFRTWAVRPAGFRDWWRTLPGDLLGLTVMLGLGIEGHTRVHDAGDVTAFVVEDERIDRYFRLHLIQTRAQTFGRYVFARSALDPETLAHECEHIRQWQKFGPFYLPAYFGSSALAEMRGQRPYWDNRFEVAARRRAATSTGLAGARDDDGQPGLS